MSDVSRAEAVRTRPGALLMVILVLLTMITPVAMNICLPGLPAMALDLKSTAAAAQLSLSAYIVAFAAAQIVHGPLADSFGRRNVLLLGMLSFTVCSVAAALAINMPMLVGLRALQGFFGAAASVIVFALVQDIYRTPAEVSRGISVLVLLSNFAPLVAPALGAQLLEVLGWRAIFWCLAALGLLTSLMIAFALRETLSPGDRKPFGFGNMFEQFADLMKKKSVLALLACAAFPVAGMFAFLSAGPFVFVELYGLSPSQFSYLLASAVLAMSIFAMLNTRLVKRFSPVRMLRFGLTLLGLAVLALCFVASTSMGGFALAAAILLFVGSLGITSPNAMAALMEGAPGASGTISSLSGTLRFGFGAVASALVALIPTSVEALAYTMAAFGALAICCFAVLAGGKKPPQH